MPLVWIVIALVLIVVVGPIFWLLPSKRDRRVAQLRTAARGAGLVVEVVALPKVDAAVHERVSAGGAPRSPNIDCAAYRLLLAKPLHGAPCWRLLKSERERGALPGWVARQPRNLPMPVDDYWRQVGSVVDALPGGCVGVEANEQAIAWFGKERLGESSPQALVEEIRAGLDVIAKNHAALATLTP